MTTNTIDQDKLNDLLASLGGPVEPIETPAVANDIYGDIEQALPPFFTKQKAVECLNGLFTFNSLSQATTQPGGPPVHYVGRKVVLRRDEFVNWLRERDRRLYGDDPEGDGKGVRRPSYQKTGAGKASGRNQERQGTGTEEPDTLRDVWSGLEDS